VIPETGLEEGRLRPLDVDNGVGDPVDTHIWFIVTEADVISTFRCSCFRIQDRLSQTFKLNFCISAMKGFTLQTMFSN
jgi:hypothetical protein